MRRVAKSCQSVLKTLAFVVWSFAVLSPAQRLWAQAGGANRIWLQDAHEIPTFHNGPAPLLRSLNLSQPLSLASGDFKRHGIEDLAVGYAAPSAAGIIAIHTGNLDAFAPQSKASFEAIARGEFPSPFLPDAKLFSVPVRPDFMGTGIFHGDEEDLVIAARGDNKFYVLTGDGRGNFSAPKAVDVGGPITALAAGEFGRAAIYSKLLVGISDQRGSYLTIYSGSAEGIHGLSVVRLEGSASDIKFGNFGGGNDAALIVNSHIAILRSANLQVRNVSLPVSVSAIALGSFLHDRNAGQQIALLSPDGAVNIAVRNEFDSRAYTVAEFRAIRQAEMQHLPPPYVPASTFPLNGWKIVESFPHVAALNPHQQPLLLRTRISDRATDDVVLVNAFPGNLVVISHPDVQPGEPTFRAGEVAMRPYTGSPIAALSMRTNVDVRPGIVALHHGQLAPSVLMPIPDPTFYPNEFDDPAVPVDGSGNADTTQFCNNTSNTDTSQPCSLREAILAANAATGTDTIQLAAGTYTLSIARVSGDYSGKFGTLEITDSVNIVGTTDSNGNPTSIIEAGTDATNGVDKILSINQDLSGTVTTASASLSNLVLQYGYNRGTALNSDGYGGAFDFDIGGSSATVTVTNCIIRNNSVHDGQGGGIAVFNTGGNASTTGTLTISNSTIENNSATPNGSGIGGDGGGINISVTASATLSNVQVLSNTVSSNAGTNPAGGGVRIDGSGGTSAATEIHASTITGNSAAGAGGGIWNQASLILDQGTLISGNNAGGNGGGLWNDNLSPDNTSINKVTITSNTASGSGGGIYTGQDTGAPQPISISFSRLAGNSATSAGANLYNNNTAITAATNNWWGTNNPASTINNVNGGTTTFDPYVALTHTASPSKIRINQSSTLTADMSKDDQGNNATLTGNLDEIAGLPITFDSALLGTIPQAQPETLGSSGQATSTFNAGGTGGLGTANAAVDQAVVAVDSNLITSATESGTTVTITTVGAHNFIAGDQVTISGVGVSGYNGTFAITSVSAPLQFSYTANAPGLANSSGGVASTGLAILQPPSITESFSPTTVAPGIASTMTFGISNGNTVSVDANFSDGLPSGLVVANTPNINNSCGGTITASAGATSISFVNSTLPAGSCTITVNVQSAADSTYSNSVIIDSTDAGNGNTATASLTVINSTTTTINSSSNPSVFGQVVTFTALVTNSSSGSAAPTGSVQFVVDGSNFGSPIALTTASSSSSSATSQATVSLAVGTHSVTVNYVNADGNFSNSSGSLGQVVNRANTSTALISSANPSLFGQSITFSARVSAVAPGAGTPSGTVTFLDGGSSIGTGTLSGGIARLTTSALAAGKHTITTSYGGDASFNGGTGALNSNPQVVNEPATMSSPLPGSMIVGQSASFSWITGVGVSIYQLYIGTTGPGSSNLDNLPMGSSTSTKPVTNLPADGSVLYVRLWSKIGSTWFFNDYTYATAGKAIMRSPTPGSTLVGQSVTFTWTSGAGVSIYQIYIGTTGAGSTDLDNIPTGTATSRAVNNIPTNGSTLYVRLWSKIGSMWYFNDYTFATAAKAMISSPTPGTTLSGHSAIFSWTTGIGVSIYQIYIGTTGAGSNNLDNLPTGTAASSPKVTNLPANGSTIYVRLWSKINGSWFFNDYTYISGP